MSGRIVAGFIAPHPPHLVYADNPPQNEPRSNGGWEQLRSGYEAVRAKLRSIDFDVLIVHSPHWKTVTGTHLLGVPHFKSLSVDPIFPNLFRYSYDLSVDVELAEAIHDAAGKRNLVTKMMRNPDFRVDYGTIGSCHLAYPEWDKPIVALSSSRSHFYFSNEVGTQEMLELGRATAEAVAATGRKAVLLASTSLSHRHFTSEPDTPEDMRYERIYHPGQLKWDQHIMGLLEQGRTQQVIDEMPDFISQSVSECKDGSLTWMLGALGMPTYKAKVLAYGTVIGTGNAIVEFDPATATEAAAK